MHVKCPKKFTCLIAKVGCEKELTGLAAGERVVSSTDIDERGGMTSTHLDAKDNL